MSRQRSIYAMALLYALIIGFSFLWTKRAIAYADPIDTMAFRFALSLLAMAVPVLAGTVKLGMRAADWARIVPVGLLYPTLFFGFQAYGLTYATSSEAGIIQASSPVFTLILAALLLRERTTAAQKLAVLCSVAGVVYILAMGGPSVRGVSAAGAGLLLASTFALSLYGVLVRGLRGRFTAYQLSFVMMASGFVCFGAAAVVRHASAGTLGGMFGPLAHGEFVAALLYIALLSSVVSSLLSNRLLARIEAYKMSLFVNLGTLVSIAAGVAIEHDRLGYYHAIGALLIVGGTLGVHVRARTSNQPASASKEVDVT
ncbi:DMT family transporter [Paenibacillus sp. MWE-103]|uniref:DMT family transporter n=1 Tax=Paenibacillus artemisiicola TaxID=1172618 RepID=A0ABS3WC14_9BACL|nr:DMT family transporter [Paenibacillus artemisiicola]MBO7745864.1 DMT family transporter [Paenibacillus artemisiicola]